MKTTGLIALLLLATSALVSAEDTATVQPEPKKEKLICKSERGGGIGARSTRTCLTKAQWNELASKSKKGADEMGRSGAESCRLQGQGQMTTPCN